MRLLVFSDIHGNSYALRQLVELLPALRYDRAVFLGDVFGYYYHQEECLELLKSIPDLIWLRGNHDQYALGAFSDRTKENDLIARYGHSYASLRERFSDADMAFLSTLPSSYTISTGGRTVGFFHGRPKDPLEGRFYPDTEAGEEEFDSYNLVFLGHTHCKIDRMIGKTRVISPGSLGQPRDGKGYGSVIFDLDKDAYEFIDAHVPSVILKQEITAKDPDLPKLFDVLSREEKKEK